MNELEVLWQEYGHLTVRVPDTLIVKDKEIKDWIYTSHVNDRILDVFHTHQDFVALYQSKEKYCLINLQEFEMVLLAISEGSCETNFVIQKFILAEVILKMKTNCKFETFEVINSSSESPEMTKASEEMIQEVTVQSKQVVQFLLYQMKNLQTIHFTWALSENLWFLTCIILEHQINKPRCSSARSHLPPPGIFKGKSRPVTASHRRDSVSSARSVKSAKSVSCIAKVPNEVSVQTEPLEKCDCQEQIKKMQKELDTALMENLELENEIAEKVKNGVENRKELEEKWKERCLEISKVISENFFEKGL